MTQTLPLAAFCPSCGTKGEGGVFCPACGHDMRLAGPGVASSQPATAVPATAVPRVIAWGGALILVGGALGVLGSFLPWLTATAAFVGTISRNGIEGGGDGIITIVAGLVASLFGVALLAQSGSSRLSRIGGFAAGAVLIGIGIIDIGSVNERIASLDTDTAIASVGMGLFVVIIGGVIAVIGSLLSPPKRA